MTAGGRLVFAPAAPLDWPRSPSRRGVGASGPPARRWQWVATAAVSLVLAATLGAGSVLLATAGDRRLAAGYQAVLSQGQGASFLAAPLQGTQGRVGTVFGCQGQPSWAMVTLQPLVQEEGRFQVQVVTRNGRYLVLGDAVLAEPRGLGGGQLAVDLSAVHELRFVGSDGRTAFAPPSTRPTPGTDLARSVAIIAA